MREGATDPNLQRTLTSEQRKTVLFDILQAQRPAAENNQFLTRSETRLNGTKRREVLYILAIDNIILSTGNIEVYQSEIQQLCDEYISTLPDESMIYKSTVFSGMLSYIYRNKLKYIIYKSKADNNINTFYHDYKLLDDIFNTVYIDLCTRYNIIPTVLQFCILCNIPREHVTDLKQGIYRQDGYKVKPETVQIVKKWFNTCESMTLSRAGNESSIGSIFLSKAVYGYSDAPVQQLEIIDNRQNETPQQIAERFRNAEKPSLIAEPESV